MVENHRWQLAAVVVLVLVLPPFLVPAGAEPFEELPGTPPSAFAAKLPIPQQGTVDLRILGVNDLHGNLEPLSDGAGGAAGGVAYLDAHLDLRERAYPGRAIRVHAGDMVGGSPLTSGYLDGGGSTA